MSNLRFAALVEPGVSVHLLAALHDEGLPPALVVTCHPGRSSCGRPVERAKKALVSAALPAIARVRPDLVASRSNTFAFARRRGWPVLHTGALATAEGERAFARHGIERLVVFGFSIVPPSVLARAPEGAIGFHPALLPEHRGANPTFWNVYDGDEGGFALFWLDEGVDTGAIIESVPVPRHPSTDAATYLDTLCRLGARRIAQLLVAEAAGAPIPPGTPQPNGRTRRRATRADAELRPEHTLREAEGTVRAATYLGGAWIANQDGELTVIDVIVSPGHGAPTLANGRRLVPWTTSDGHAVRLLCAPRGRSR